MRFVYVTALVLLWVTPAPAQEWIDFASRDDGFRVNFPAQPKVTDTTYTSEYGAMLPAHVYSVARDQERYSITVVDYRGIEKMHADRAAKCQAAKGANQQDGDTCQNDFRVDVAEEQRFRDLVDLLDFSAGPSLPAVRFGGSQTQPLFNVNMTGVGQAVISGIAKARRERAERIAQEEVERAFIQFCSTHECAAR